MSETTDSQSNLDAMRLCIEDDEGVQATYPLLNHEVKVGRAAHNDVCLNQRNVSRDHAVIYVDRENHSLVVQDLDSYTGIKLNGKQILGRSTMRLGDYLQIGDYGISLEVEGAGAANAHREAERIRSESESALLSPDQRARLIVVSNNLAGREYHLNRAELIIGREPSENDLVINHRSISRVHAKIVWKNNEFTMIDLSSANGMKINGSPFAAARLVRGAVIQLGMVKLRYVAPGEEYQPKSLADDLNYHDGSLDRRGSSKSVLIAGILFVVIFVLSYMLNTKIKDPKIPARQTQGSMGAATEDHQTEADQAQGGSQAQSEDSVNETQGESTEHEASAESQQAQEPEQSAATVDKPVTHNDAQDDDSSARQDGGESETSESGEARDEEAGRANTSVKSTPAPKKSKTKTNKVKTTPKTKRKELKP